MKVMITLALLLLLVIAVLPSPLGSATSNTSYSAPYLGGQKVTRSTTTVGLGNCGVSNGSTFKLASANLSSGVLHVDALASVNGTCGLGIGAAIVTAEAGIRSPMFSATTSGPANVSFHWQLTWSISAKWQGTGDANSEGVIIGFLWDMTNNSPVPHSRQFIIFADFGGATKGTDSASNFNQTLSISGMLVSGHSYRAVALLEAHVGAEVNPGTGDASAAANLAFRGGYGALLSIIVT
jgi:hypothetical protein